MGRSMKDLQMIQSDHATAAKAGNTKEPPYTKIMGFVYGIFQRFSKNDLTAKESVILIKSFLTEHGA